MLVAFIDFANAFDTVQHEYLWEKLHFPGADPGIFRGGVQDSARRARKNSGDVIRDKVAAQ